MSYPVSSSPFPLAFNLFDTRADWPEIVLVVGVALVAAALVSRGMDRILRWALHDAVGAHVPEAYRKAARRPLVVVRVLVFLLVWVGLSLPLLDAIGVPLALGTNWPAVRDWLFASGMRVTLIVTVAWLVLRVAQVMTTRIERELSHGEGLDVLERSKRAQTLGRLVYNVVAVLVGSIALMMVLRELGIDIVPMLTGAGIVGVALGFGAQWLVRDVIAGFFLILENQVRVGDGAAINGVGGIIEAVNLRTLVLRDAEGAVHVFPNGGITTLANRTKDYSVLHHRRQCALPPGRGSGDGGAARGEPGHGTGSRVPGSDPGATRSVGGRRVSRHEDHDQEPASRRCRSSNGWSAASCGAGCSGRSSRIRSR